jgi:hypothetical protein
MLKPRRFMLPSGLNSCWKLWRLCCCRYGLYPLALAPILTLAFLLSSYSSVGCQFIEVEVGFTPSNRAWNSSQADLGLFFHYQPDTPDYNKYREVIQEDCVLYSVTFEEIFMQQDRTWKVARIMAMVAATAGFLSSLVAWCICFTPVPAGCLWPGLLLPSVMISFIAEGSKFLFFDIALCRSALWFPSGVDSPPTSAESCVLGRSAYAAIAAGSIQLVALLMVCLKAPQKRELDPDFGIEYRTGAELDLDEASDARTFAAGSGVFPVMERRLSGTASAPRYIASSIPYDEDETSVMDDMYTDGPNSDELSEIESGSDAYPTKPKAPPSDPKKVEKSVEAPALPQDARVSESRKAVMSKMERNASIVQQEEALLVEQLVSDLDNSFQEPYTSETVE